MINQIPFSKWSEPNKHKKGVGRFTDLRLFHETLELAADYNRINRQVLQNELPQRLQGLMLVDKPSPGITQDLLRELQNFDWIKPDPDLARSTEYILTDPGRSALRLYQQNKIKEFRQNLAVEMDKLYAIPAWFVYRLWAINPKRQGEIVIPLPPRGWHPKARMWNDIGWTDELAQQSLKSHNLINIACPGSLPVEGNEWLSLVKDAWTRLSNLEPRGRPIDGEQAGQTKSRTYAPRTRLSYAMREAAVQFLFSDIFPGHNQYETNRPLTTRKYLGWCRRLEALELIFYTDSHPLIPGRLIFPTSVFHSLEQRSGFQKLGKIESPDGRYLWLHRPSWYEAKKKFMPILWKEYQLVSSRVSSHYVALQDVRDEVCRQMRISAVTFEEFLEQALHESVLPSSKWSISVETDIREDQRSAPRMVRRPVFLDGTIHSLIAMYFSHSN